MDGEPLAIILAIGGVVLLPVLVLLMLKRGVRPYAATVLGLSSLLGGFGCLGVRGDCIAIFLMLFSFGVLVFGVVAVVVAIVVKVVRKHAA